MATPPDMDAEIAAIVAISAALENLADEEARRRVFTYVMTRYLPGLPPPILRPVSAAAPQATVPVEYTQKELPGIAHVTDGGELKLTVRDLKAKSGLDAAVRLTYVAIYAYQKLTGQPFSSRKGLTPLLREWRLYDGNTRARLAKERGIIRSDDQLSLDAHARRDAERYIEEILDDEVTGLWRPR